MPPNVEWPTRPPFKAKFDSAGPMPGRVLLGSRHWLHWLFRTQRWRQAVQGWERSRQAERNVRNRAWPLSFVAQIDFAELHAVHGLEGFPLAGQLLLFCDPFDCPWGEREDLTRMRAIFTEAPAKRLERRRAPQEFDAPEASRLMPRGYVFKPRALHPTAWLLPPPRGSRELHRLEVENPDAWQGEGDVSLAFRQFWDGLFAKHPDTFGPHGEMIHQVGGTAFSIQEPVDLACVRYARNSAEVAENWQLVLQIDSDIEVGMEWGDVGRLYLCARKSDLAARRFDRCWMVRQCY
jgi:Domain of unknown function (DUF1963)